MAGGGLSAPCGLLATGAKSSPAPPRSSETTDLSSVPEDTRSHSSPCCSYVTPRMGRLSLTCGLESDRNPCSAALRSTTTCSASGWPRDRLRCLRVSEPEPAPNWGRHPRRSGTQPSGANRFRCTSSTTTSARGRTGDAHQPPTAPLLRLCRSRFSSPVHGGSLQGMLIHGGYAQGFGSYSQGAGGAGGGGGGGAMAQASTQGGGALVRPQPLCEPNGHRAPPSQPVCCRWRSLA